MQIDTPMLADEGVQAILNTFDAYQKDSIRLVGGCVRDAIMERPVNDIDFATVLTPDVATRICKHAGFHVEPTGIDHGTITAIWNHIPYEITTLRRDVETDGRRAVVAFSTDWAEDAYRRDFTFNALYMDRDGVIYDYSPDEGGIADALNRRVVFMGDAEQRIREDYLRILRAYRFRSVLDGELDAAAHAAIAATNAGIDTLSGERLEKETIKLLYGVSAGQAIREMDEAGVFKRIFGFRPEGVHSLDAIVARLARARQYSDQVGSVSPLAALLGWQPGIAQSLLYRWKSSNVLRDHVVKVLQVGPVDLSVDTAQYRRAAYRQKSPLLAALRLTLTWVVEPSVAAERIAELRTVEIPMLPVQGRDVLALGVKPGRQVGAILAAVERQWVDADFPAEPAVRQMLTDEIKQAA